MLDYQSVDHLLTLGNNSTIDLIVDEDRDSIGTFAVLTMVNSMVRN